MDEKIQDLVSMANKRKGYQALLITFGCLIFITTNVISSTYGFFSTEPTVLITIDGKAQNFTLNETLCEQYKNNYKIINLEKNTWYYNYGEECNKLVTWMITFLGNFGSVLGLFATPYSIKYLGQKNSVLIMGYAYSIVTFINIFMPNFGLTLFLSFLNNFTGTLMEMAFFMLQAENCPGKLRTIGLNITGSGYCFSAVIFIALFDYFNSWKIPFIISAVSNLLLTIAIHFLIYENPIYYLKKGKVDLFVKTLMKIAKFNKCNESFDPIANRILREYDQEQREHQDDELDELNKSLLSKFKNYVLNIEKEREHYTIIDVLRFRSHRYLFLLMCLINLISGGVYQSYSENVTNLPGNNYVNGIISYALQGIIIVNSGFLMNSKLLKRKGLLVLSILITIILGMILYFFKNMIEILKIILNLVMITSSFIFYQVTWTYNVEVYSSKLLNVAFTWNNMVGTAGKMVVPYVNNYYPNTMNLILSVILAISAAVFFFLPETYGKPMQNDIPEEVAALNNRDDINNLNSHQG